MKKSSLFFLLLTVVIILVSCTTYYIPVENFKTQFHAIDSTRMREVTVRGPLGGRTKYKILPIDYVNVIDKNGNAFKLLMSPSLEVRFTDTNGRKVTVYADQISFDDSNVIGVRSRVVSSIKTNIPIGAIKKIEIQDGKKNYHYVDTGDYRH